MPLRTTLSRSTKTLAAQEVVELVLARAVVAHEPAERGDLVRRVVVDVHVGMRAQALVDEVDELLERGALARAVVRVQRREVASTSIIPQRYSSEPSLSQNGLPSKSKKRSPGDGSGRSAKPAPGCGWRRRYSSVPVSRAWSWSSACSRIFAKVSAEIPGGGSAGARPSAASVAMPAEHELVDLRAADAGDAGEVVDRVPVRVADRLEVADVAVRDRPGLGVRRIRDELLEPLLGRGGSTRRTRPA